MLCKTPDTNHAYIRIGGHAAMICPTCEGKKVVEDGECKGQPLGAPCPVCSGTGEAFLDVDTRKDPPCLRFIQWRVVKDHNGVMRQDVHVVFRSWDLWGGFPSNLAGLQILNEEVAKGTGYTPGRVFAFSPGLHLYGNAIEQARNRLEAGR